MLQGVFYLDGFYDVLLGGQPAGKVQIESYGLYYRITCRCQIPENMIYRLYAVTEGKRENLGVVAPEGDGYCLIRKIPAKRLEKCTGFILSARSEADTGKFVPIYPEEPFSYIMHLETAFLDIRNGQVGACWKQNPGAE